MILVVRTKRQVDRKYTILHIFYMQYFQLLLTVTFQSTGLRLLQFAKRFQLELKLPMIKICLLISVNCTSGRCIVPITDVAGLDCENGNCNRSTGIGFSGSSLFNQSSVLCRVNPRCQLCCGKIHSNVFCRLHLFILVLI